MEKDKIYTFRKFLSIIVCIMIFTTLGLFLVNTQVKTVNFDYYGKTLTVKTLSSTVEDFIIQNNIVVSKNDLILPDLKTYIDNGSIISISSCKEYSKIDVDNIISENKPMIAKVEEVIEEIPFNEESRSNSSVDRGITNVVKEGKYGQKSTKYLVKYDGDVEIERAKIGTETIIEAQNKVVEVGTKLPVLASRSSLVESVAAEIPTAEDGFVAYNISLPVEQQQYAYNICKKYGIEYELFLAVMYQESRFNPSATGVSAYGLCQIHSSNFGTLSYTLGLTDYYDPYDNMTAGAYLLAKYMNIAKSHVGNEAIEIYALNAYNMGEGAYYTTCFSQGILNRNYSNSVISIRNKIKTYGGI